MSCRFSVLFIGILLTAAVSCRTQVQEEKFSLPADGAIYVLGQTADCAYFKHALLAYDGHDNASIAHTSDGLPDFCGETVVLVNDRTGESGVENLMSKVIDTLEAKVFILASPELYAADLSGITHLPVLRPINLVEEAIAADFGSAASVVVICDATDVVSGIYESLLDCKVISMAMEDEPALEFLSACLRKGIGTAVDAIVINTPAVDADELRESIAETLQQETEDAALLRELVPQLPRIYDPRRVTACKCYELLWQENAFTHRIAHPVSVSID